jgi:hypothetical protein
MTKRLEEVFGMSPSEPETEEDIVEEEAQSIEQSKELIHLINSELATTEKIDAALPMVGDLNEHDTDMDEIHKHAMETFEKLVDIGMNVEAHAGSKFFEGATQMLKTAMEAKDSKVDRKLKMITLQLQKAKLDLATEKESKNGKDADIETEGALILDRNELLKRIAEARKISDSDK